MLSGKFQSFATTGIDYQSPTLLAQIPEQEEESERDGRGLTAMFKTGDKKTGAEPTSDQRKRLKMVQFKQDYVSISRRWFN